MTQSHRCMPAAQWVEACEILKSARGIIDAISVNPFFHIFTPGIQHAIRTVAEHLHRVEQILLTSDEVETRCARAMEEIR